MTTGTRKTGEFCWINMLTPQPAEAREFFGKLLGWTYVEMPGMGHAMQVGGRDIGGLFDLDGPNTPPGHAAAHRRHGEGRERRRHVREGDGARRQGEAGVRHHGPGPDGRLPRSQRRRVRRVGAEEDARHRRRQQPARRAELVRDA